jgi:MFS family permease
VTRAPADLAAAEPRPGGGRVGHVLRTITGGVPTRPLAVLFGLNLVDEFDRVAFAALTPEIRDAFGLSDTAIAAVALVSGVFILLASMPIGILADRFDRIRIVVVAALAWGAMSVATGLAPTVAVLFVARLVAGSGRIANEIVHPSLLTDWYAPGVQPRVIMVHRLANPIGALSGVLAGAIGMWFGWRWAFVVLAVPTFLLVARASRLREPPRTSGHAGVATSPHVGFVAASRVLWRLRSLRRIWVSSFLLGIGAVSIPAVFLSLFFEGVHGFGPVGRGTVQFVYGLGIVAGLAAGGWLASRAAAAGDTPRLATINGWAGLWFAGSLVLLVLAPWAAAAVGATFLVAVGGGAFQPAYYPLVAQVVPPRIKSQAYAWAVIFIAFGISIGIGLADVGERHGFGTVMVVLAAVTGIAGLVAMSAARFVDEDVRTTLTPAGRGGTP